jgi:hypothetical protein
MARVVFGAQFEPERRAISHPSVFPEEQWRVTRGGKAVA